MKIEFVEIQNFRKLKSCKIDLNDTTTVFVGANNSGKTSAMDALIVFLKKSQTKRISTTDFTLTNWSELNKVANEWIVEQDPKKLNLKLSTWQELVPTLDIWLQVDKSEVHYVDQIIPTLKWKGGQLGIRLSFEPRNVEELYKQFKHSYDAAAETSKKKKKEDTFQLWPTSMRDFLDRELHNFFYVKAYILDTTKIKEGIPQKIDELSEPLSSDPLEGLFKVDVINAQRGFSDPSAQDGIGSSRKLSTQLRYYFEKHLNPDILPDVSDLNAISAIQNAKKVFDEKLNESFKNSIGELEGLNYPGFNDPKIYLTSNINPHDSINHEASVQFNILNGNNTDTSFHLPEQYNGLGYQNLISMIFSLIRYRDEWMRVGKVGKKIENIDKFIEPIHLVLIEEPEAHLHAQVQQVFVKKAYDVLRNHTLLGKTKQFSSQLVISTHSSHLAHEVDFIRLRYFKRSHPSTDSEIPKASVINLSNVFGDGSDTTKFAIRYLKATHCDLFFADAVILVEGPAERILVPHFIKNHYESLNKSFISILEIGGSHAHRLRPLIEAIGLISLVVTDLDSIEKDSSSKVQPFMGKEYRTGNNSIKTWIPKTESLDTALKLSFDKKELGDIVRIAYQYEVSLKHENTDVKAIPYTFEDALALDNAALIKKVKSPKGLLKKIVTALEEKEINNSCRIMFEALKTGNKAEMALDLLFLLDPKELKPPKYIAEGLEWLQNKLDLSKISSTSKTKELKK